MSSEKDSTRSLTPPGPWLRRFVGLTALVTLGLVCVGGLVTSHEAGMAVPDWPNTYGYNMFLFPVSKWMGGILYEHSHRLLASLVGLLTAILAAWLWVRETRSTARWSGIGVMVFVLALMGIRQLPIYIGLASLAPIVIGVSIFRIRQEPGSLRWWGVIALAAVILQGVLGGLRVVLFKDQIGIFHATLAQLFFALMCGIALFTSSWWQRTTGGGRARTPLRAAETELGIGGQGLPALPISGIVPGLRNLVLGTTLLILIQLVLGATMRHQHAGLAIPDFPLAYGKLWPAMDAPSVSQYNQLRREVVATNPITAFQIGLQMAHRIMAAVICLAVAACAWKARRRLGSAHVQARFSLVWVGTILLQASLGAGTIWSNKAADIATAHVLVGALSLAIGAMMSCVVFREMSLSRVPQKNAVASESVATPHFSSQPASVAGGIK